MKLIIVFLLCFYSFLPGFSQVENPFLFSKEYQKAYLEINSMRLENGKQILKQIKSKSIAIDYYLQDLADMIYLMSSEDKAFFEKNKTLETQRIELIKKLNLKTPYAKFIEAEIRLHWAFVKLKLGHDMAGALNIIKAYKLLDENQKLYPNFLPNKKSLGILHILIGAVPQNYAWVTKVIGIKGNVALGISELNDVAEKDPVFGIEAKLNYFIAKGYVLKMDKNTIDEFQKFAGENPQNAVIQFFYASILMKEAMSEAAMSVLNDFPTGKSYLKFPYPNYLRADIALQNGDYLEAENGYLLFLKAFNGENFYKDTFYKLFLTSWLQGNSQKAEFYLNKVKEIGKTNTESDKHALKEVGLNPLSKNKTLMKARLAFDGGFLEKSSKLLNEISSKNLKNNLEMAEYLYRKGRVLHKTGNKKQAIQTYTEAYKKSIDAKYYFGASSVLQIGYIYLENKDKANAKINFELALNYPKHEYKNSIDNKAKAELNLLGH